MGLLINLRHIIDSPAHLARAREALIALTVLLTLSIFVLIPKQGRVALGIELLVLSVIVLGMSLRLQWGTVHRLPQRRRRWWVRRLLGLNSATLAIGMAGAGLVTEKLGGMLWLVMTTLICLLWSTYNAWSLAIRPVTSDE
ncbi:MAG: hypothetical protein ACM4AI_10475 [Acidobacteriota bacterium]